MTFYKIRKHLRNSLGNPYWVTKSFNQYGEIWRNLRGGWCLHDKDDEVLAVAEAPDVDAFIDLYRKDIYSYLIKKDSDLGWLSPDGDFYGCDYTNHEELAELYFGKEDLEMEKNGWVKIFRSVELGEPVYCQHKLTLRQRCFIEDRCIKFHYC